jgi:hypothetical protein
MPKPIAIIKIKILPHLTENKMAEMSYDIRNWMQEDYYPFVVFDENFEQKLEVQVYNGDNIKDIDLQNLQDVIDKKIVK